MGLDSRGQIYRDHVTIERGLAQVNASKGYAVVAGRIRIDSPQRALVRVTDSRTVVVTALQGITEVKNGKGILVAMVPPGGTLEFSDAQTPADDASVAGCLERIGNRYLLRDDTTHVVFELVGPDLEGLVRSNNAVGMTVGVTGSIDPNAKAISPAAETIRVRDLNASSQQKCTGTIGAVPPAAPVAPAAPGAPAAAGLSLPAQVGIIGAVAVGGTLGGLAAAGVIGGGAAQTTPSAASR